MKRRCIRISLTVHNYTSTSLSASQHLPHLSAAWSGPFGVREPLHARSTIGDSVIATQQLDVYRIDEIFYISFFFFATGVLWRITDNNDGRMVYDVVNSRPFTYLLLIEKARYIYYPVTFDGIGQLHLKFPA